MKNIKENKAITLIALIITIIVLLLLAGTSISMITGQDGILTKAANAKAKTEEANREEAEALEVMKAIMNGTYDAEYNKDKSVNKPKLSEGMIPVKYNGTTWVVCSEDDVEWYNYKDMKWVNIMLSDGTYKADTVEVGQEVADSELGSMFVWIPRYAYSIEKYKTDVASAEGTKQEITNVKFLVGTSNTDEEGTIYKTDYNVDEQTGTTTPKIVHPAFKFGESNITGFWSAKFEASMAEANDNTTTNNNKAAERTVKILPNKESWRYITVGNCFTNCLEMNAEGNVYGLTTSADSHLMKNNEWGAIAYLATSQYGKTPAMNTNGTSYKDEGSETTKYHAYTAGSETEGGYKNVATQSTTGNVTGIYDLNGGSWEYVAAYYANKNSYLKTYGTSTYFDNNNELKEEYKKYWDKYEVSEDELEYAKSAANLWNKDKTYNAERKRITDLRYNLMKNIKGDAMYEVMKTYSYYGKIINDSNEEVYAWLVNADDTTTTYGKSYYNSDYVLIGNCLRPFLLRGGAWWSGTSAGVFASGGSGGFAYFNSGFRPVVVAE